MLNTVLKLGGIPSICSAHPDVLRETMLSAGTNHVLIESTCNQVNQFGGYTGMTPEHFVKYIHKIAEDVGYSIHNIFLGGDHLGPNVWRNEPSSSAMQKSAEMIRHYALAGYTKFHLDCSMPLLDDPEGLLKPEIIAQRAAQLASVAEETRAKHCLESQANNTDFVYVIGTEVPSPGGAIEREDSVHITQVSDVQETIDIHRKAFNRLGLENAWERVVAVVVQPGVEFSDDFVLDYQPEKTKALSKFIETQGMVYEAHSTDYQSPAALRNLVQDHFAILKVGPWLTFAYREAIFALALMENELFLNSNDRSNITTILDNVMVEHPEYWEKYYEGNKSEQLFKRKYSLSDRIRYYWVQPEVQHSLNVLLRNLSSIKLPISLISQFTPLEKSILESKHMPVTPNNIISARISHILGLYWAAFDRKN